MEFDDEENFIDVNDDEDMEKFIDVDKEIEIVKKFEIEEIVFEIDVEIKKLEVVFWVYFDNLKGGK